MKFWGMSANWFAKNAHYFPEVKLLTQWNKVTILICWSLATNLGRLGYYISSCFINWPGVVSLFGKVKVTHSTADNAAQAQWGKWECQVLNLLEMHENLQETYVI